MFSKKLSVELKFKTYWCIQQAEFNLYVQNFYFFWIFFSIYSVHSSIGGEGGAGSGHINLQI